MMVQQLSRNNKSIEPQTSISQTNAILSTIHSNQQAPLIEGMHPNDKSGQLWSVYRTPSNAVMSAGKIDSAIEGLTAPIQVDIQKKSVPSQSGNFIDKLYRMPKQHPNQPVFHLISCWHRLRWKVDGVNMRFVMRIIVQPIIFLASKLVQIGKGTLWKNND